MPATPRDHLTLLVEQLGLVSRDSEEALIARIDLLHENIEAASHTADPDVYGRHYHAVFDALDRFDAALANTRYLQGNDTPTLADWWLWCLLVRFDVVYYGLYKLNRRRLVDYANLGPYVTDLFQHDGVDKTVDFAQIKRHHYQRDETINPKRLVPVGGVPELRAPHDRLRFDQAELTRVGTEEDQTKQRRQGEWVRKLSGHRHRISADGSSEFPAERGRYHLYVSNNCPWSHRAALTRSVKGLTDVISLDTLYYRRDPDRGWQFRPDEEGCTPDSIYGSRFLIEIYQRVGSKEKSVPVLFDKKTDTIVSNESAEIVRMLGHAFDAFTDVHLDLYPEPLRQEIDQLNAWIYTEINNGAYKAGFASKQDAYEDSYHRVFAALEGLDTRLASRRYLTGDLFTEADLRLFPTLFRFDHVYFTRFRLNRRMVREHQHLFRWLRDVVSFPGVADASNLEHCKRGYFGRTGNNIVPIGPDLGFESA